MAVFPALNKVLPSNLRHTRTGSRRLTFPDDAHQGVLAVCLAGKLLVTR